MKCIAIDDEPLALKQICAYISKTEGLVLDASFESSVEAQKYLLKNEVDLMFVDINMPDLNGMDLVKSLVNPPMVVFTTAYSEYAVEGFKVDALDYILKPVAYEDFKRAVDKAAEIYRYKQIDSGEIPTQFNSNQNFLFIKSEYKVIRINFNDIKYIESMREYVRFHLETGKPIMSLLTIKNIENYLPKEKFMRVHRSYIVNLDKITTIERFKIVFDSDNCIPISEQYKDKFQAYLDQNFAL
ncbi:MAG: LytTR family DNA-binding domain-containing protein [Bacteroidales bacterium]|nr:LytTR family DNA-binding domain-containing protein [Bacteroidales bacterium]